MKGYIKRLEREIERLEFRKGRIESFLVTRGEEIDDKQRLLLTKQKDLMEELLKVMRERLEYELKLQEGLDRIQPELPFEE